MDRESPVNLRVEMAPDDGTVFLSGSITITRTTMSVFKLCEVSDEEPLFIGVCSVPLLKIALEKSKLFASSKSLLLMGFSDHLFVNASLSAGIVPPKGVGAKSTQSTSSGICLETPFEERPVDALQSVDNPALWKRLRLEFPSPEDCDRCAKALLARKAEDVTRGDAQKLRFSSEYAKIKGADSPKAYELMKSGSFGSASSYYRRNNRSNVGNSDNMFTCRSQLIGQDDGLKSYREQATNKDSLLQTNNNNNNSIRELKTPSERPTRQPVQQSRGAVSAHQQHETSQRHKLTLSESRDGPNTPLSSHRGRRLPDRSQPTDSCRELNTPSDGGTRQYVEQSRGAISAHQQHETSKRENVTPSESRDGANTPLSSHRGRRLPDRSHPTDSCRELNTPSERPTRQPVQQSCGAISAHQQHETSKREKVTPSESRDGANTPLSSHLGRRLPERSHPTDSCRGLDTPSDRHTAPDSLMETLQDKRYRPNSAHGSVVGDNVNGKVRHSGDFAAEAGRNASNMRVLNASTGNGNPRRLTKDAGPAVSVPRGVAVSPQAQTSLESNSFPMPARGLSSSKSPSTWRSEGSRTEHQLFMRSVMKFMHHRLHFMQYLHRELVHEAYLVEEAKICGDRGRSVLSASFGRPMSRATSLSPRSPRRTAQSSVGEESVRLREIEERLRTVEKLHEEAGQEREEALRLRREAERKLELINRDIDSLRNGSTQICNNVDLQKYGFLNSGNVMNGAKFIPVKNESLDNARPSSQGRACESLASRTSKLSCVRLGDGQVVTLPTFDKLDYQQVEAVSEMDYCTTIVDRYIYGDEWHLLYPSREADVRFNALIDTCLMLKLPRRFVTITNVFVDQPGLRLTAEIRHDSNTLPRDVIERRFASQPFYILQRFYELRHCIHGDSGFTPFQSRNEQRPSRSISRVMTPRGINRNGVSNYCAGNEYLLSFNGDESMFDYGGREQEMKMREVQRRTAERARQRERDIADERERKQMALQQERWRQQLDQLEEEESYRRGRIVLSEAKDRQSKDVGEGFCNWPGATTLLHGLEEEESLQRAIVEVGYARQLQVLARAQRRNWALVRITTQETERRMRIAEQEGEDRLLLDLMMNPRRLAAKASEPEIDEQRHRQRLTEAEANQRRQISSNIRSFISDALDNAMEALIGDERTGRMMIVADEMKERLDVLCSREAPKSRELPHVAMVTPQLWQVLLADEAAGRSHIVNDEERRRRFFQREFIVTTEDVARNVIELHELDEHIAMLDDIVHRNRAMLERRRQERKELVQLATEEQYYRKGLLGDEQDEWEVLMELFDTEQNDILVEAARMAASASELESPQRRRCLPRSPRQTKPFHYMTFVPADMDHPPSAALVIEGILGCSVNKNLEVTNIARRLPRVEGEELQFQAGDMILDVAGFSLHSISHLREVLSNRTMQIQCEAAEEFAGIPEDELTTNPALQKYIEVLCEHHNFLVQVLRGCDIFQIIVKS